MTLVPIGKLTKTQLVYLDAMTTRDQLHSGWGGLSSVAVVRRLNERGLCRLQEYGPSDWRASITDAGRDVLYKAKGWVQ